MKLFSIVLVLFFFMSKLFGQITDKSIEDIDGNHYNIITIGKKLWLKENLRTSRYNDGTPIPVVSNSLQWSNLLSGGCCWYDNDSALNNNPYGKLYNWYAVQTGNVCPVGWHVPSDFEWADLSEFLGGKEVAGSKLKSNQQTYWKKLKEATNESGFNAVPGGYRNSSGTYYYLGYLDYWWSSTERSSGSAWYWYVYFDTGYLYRDNDYKTMGHAIRCIKD